jgi:tetratricopeptide (TPR) repeat protein
MKRLLALLVLIVATTSTAPAAAQGAPDLYSESYTKEASGDYSGALASMEKLPTTHRKGYVYWLRRGWLLYLNGRHDQAITSYDKAIAAKPKAVEPLLGKSLPEMALRKWRDAASTTQKAQRLDPDNYLATSRLAYSLYNLGRYREAEPHYERLVTLYPSDMEMTAGLAWSMLKQGKKSAAKKLFEEILEIAPAHASARQGLEATQ